MVSGLACLLRWDMEMKYAGFILKETVNLNGFKAYRGSLPAREGDIKTGGSER